MELYKKYRPRTLDRIIGNENTVASLRNMLERKTLPHVILFSGPSGTGKTTLARIIKTELGCHDMDFAEVNSGSFRGIDSIRDVARNMNLAPTGPCRIWYFDEVHKWTNDAQNAALKMLEDTPSHIYFLLATTDTGRLIKAVQTRCCELPLRALTYQELENLAARVARKENIELSKESLDTLVSAAAGSARMLLVLLDKVANLDDAQRAAAIEEKAAEEAEGIELCRLLLKDPRASWKTVAETLKNLKGDPESTRRAVLGYARTVLLSGKANTQAYMVLQSFSDNFFDSGDAGLARACFEAIVAS